MHDGFARRPKSDGHVPGIPHRLCRDGHCDAGVDGGGRVEMAEDEGRSLSCTGQALVEGHRDIIRRRRRVRNRPFVRAGLALAFIHGAGRPRHRAPLWA